MHSRPISILLHPFRAKTCLMANDIFDIRGASNCINCRSLPIETHVCFATVRCTSRIISYANAHYTRLYVNWIFGLTDVPLPPTTLPHTFPPHSLIFCVWGGNFPQKPVVSAGLSKHLTGSDHLHCFAPGRPTFSPYPPVCTQFWKWW